MNYELFYLLAFQRSGTTLLCHLLDKHPEIVCAEEPEISKRIVYKQFELLKDSSFDSIKQSLAFYHVEPDQYIDLVESYLDGRIDENNFLKSCYILFNNKSAKYVGAKEVCDLTAYKYDYLKKLISFHNKEIKFVFIERDIKGVVNSFIKLGFYPLITRKLTDFNLKIFAKRYMKCLNYIKKNLSTKNTHHLTFENLMKHPQDELSKIYDFLGVDSSKETLDRILNTTSHGIRQNYTGIQEEIAIEWRKNLSDKNILWLDKLYKKSSWLMPHSRSF